MPCSCTTGRRFLAIQRETFTLRHRWQIEVERCGAIGYSHVFTRYRNGFGLRILLLWERYGFCRQVKFTTQISPRRFYKSKLHLIAFGCAIWYIDIELQHGRQVLEREMLTILAHGIQRKLGISQIAILTRKIIKHLRIEKILISVRCNCSVQRRIKSVIG